MKKLKILISAYACSPNRGSEPGVGWNFVYGLSKFHEVHVIVEKRKWKKPINTYLDQNSEFGKNVKFYFIDKKRNKWLRKLWPPSYYWFYRQWQKKAYRLALSLEQAENFNIIHQLTLVGYREPGYLWKIDKPFVWGPIGGIQNSPWRFLPSLGIKGFVFYSSRNVVNSWQRRFMSRPKNAATRKNGAILVVSPENSSIVRNIWNKSTKIISEVGQHEGIAIKPLPRKLEEPLRIVWSGVHTPGKNLGLLLRAVEQLNIPFVLHILGQGSMTQKWKGLAKKLKIEEYCIWHGWVEHENAIAILRSGHVFVITSISELTATVTLEALSYGLPIICLDHCGFAYVVTEKCGIKVAVRNPKLAVLDIKMALEKLYYDELLRQKLSLGALKRAADFSWDKKIKKLNDVYNTLLGT